MPRPDPVKTFLMEGGADCEEVKIIHSNTLQEAKSYTYVKKRPDENNPLKFYLLNFGNSVQPGDPVMLKALISGDGQIYILGSGNPDISVSAPAGSAVFVPDPPLEYTAYLIWPCEFEVISEGSGFLLRSRKQLSSYKPGLTDAEIEADPMFSSEYSYWLQDRSSAWFRRYRVWPPPPEEYEIENAQQDIITGLRNYWETQWTSWTDNYSTYEHVRAGDYWTGSRDSAGHAVYNDFRFVWTPSIEARLCREDGSEIDGEGVDPVTLLAYEFVSESGLDIQNIDDGSDAKLWGS